MKRFLYTVMVVAGALGLWAQDALQETNAVQSVREPRTHSVDADPVVVTPIVREPRPRSVGNGPVVVIPLHGQVERGLLSALRRSLKDAERQHARAIIIDMDTPGGRLGAAEDIMRMLMRLEIPTYTYINPDAISAGALIALATDFIYMAPGSRIGDAMPIMMSPMPTGGAKAPQDDLKSKVMSPLLAMARNTAQHTGRDPELVVAMIDPDAEYSVDGEILCAAGDLLTLTASEAAQPVGPQQRPLLSEGTFNSLEELLEHLEFSVSDTRHIGSSAAERIARVIDGFPMTQILLALGLLGISIEFRTPGFGIPGIAGLLCLTLWMWGHHIAGLAGMEEIILLALGIALLALEIFVIPGFGVAGISGIVCIIVALLLAMTPSIPGQAPWLIPWSALQEAVVSLTGTFILTVVLAVIAGRFLPETRAFRRLTLQSELARSVTASENTALDPLIGLTGEALTELRPSGVARIGAQRMDVVTHGVFIAKGQPIVVAEHHGNRIVVVPASTGAPESANDQEATV